MSDKDAPPEKAIASSDVPNLFELIGAPLAALVQAEFQALQATSEFIERIGFVAGTGSESARDADFGDLRMITFRHHRSDANGATKQFQVQIPMLSLLPIPMIQIKNAELEFYAKIIDVQVEKAKTSIRRIDAEDGDFLSGRRVSLRASISSQPSSVPGAPPAENQMKIKINVEQAHVSSGLAKLLNLMDHSLQNQVVEDKKPDESKSSQSG